MADICTPDQGCRYPRSRWRGRAAGLAPV